MNYPITIEIPRCVTDDLYYQTENANGGHVIMGGVDTDPLATMLSNLLETRKGREFTITTEEQAQAVFDSASHRNEIARGEIYDGDYTDAEMADYRRERDQTTALRREMRDLGFIPKREFEAEKARCAKYVRDEIFGD